MKRAISILLSVVLCFAALLPVTIYAQTYNLGGTDMSISVDDSIWYVFTRDNIMNNAELEGFGLTYDEMYGILCNNEAYMDAILFYEDGEFVELFVRKRALDSGIVNLSNYNDKQVLEMAKELAQKQGAETYSVYENRYKFAKLEYFDSNYGYYICEFITCVNKDNYTITFQSASQFTDWEYEEIKKIVDSIEFDVDATIKEKKSTSIFDGIAEKAIVGAVSGGIIGLITVAINSKKKKNNETNQESVRNGPEID